MLKLLAVKAADDTTAAYAFNKQNVIGVDANTVNGLQYSPREINET